MDGNGVLQLCTLHSNDGDDFADRIVLRVERVKRLLECRIGMPHR